MITDLGPSGSTLDFFCYDVSGNVYNGSAFVAFVDGDYASYRVAATEIGTSGRYKASQPTGTVYYELRIRSGTLAGSTIVAYGNVDSERLSNMDTVLTDVQTSVDSMPNDNADALLDRADAIETGWTLRKVLRILAAAMGGKSSSNGCTIRNLTDSKARITATVDEDGNRTAVTLDAT